MVANPRDGHPALAHCLRFAATTVGRDKLLRTAQYFSQFYIWQLYRRKHQPSAIDSYIALWTQLGTTRKILRIGNFLENLQTLARVLSNKNPSEPVLKFLAIGGQLGFGGYLVFDNITALKAIGIYKLPSSERLEILADKFWAAGLICSIMTGIYTLLHSQSQQRTKPEEGERESNDKKRAMERSAAWIQLISDLCDLTVPAKGLGVPVLDDGLVGMAGTVSSLIGVRNQWKKTA
ncbi:peroxin PEX11-2 [Aspergillus bombycis]|uniref:Peroxin PEX11-2 n=1 Tax=Aspergillus bombycis TaxID=109264 RepID=A0A1F7ZTN6_9EURO|nr:peroxin PEX11-2 [Aspergillus bombycis]OGM42639.1 peroxin PEX11-2 [Aspergillus bombycis]